MNEINNVIKDIYTQLEEATSPVDVKFTVEQINILSDEFNLGEFKFTNAVPIQFEFSTNRLESFRKFALGDKNKYRVLEFTLLSNPALKSIFLKYFPMYEECYV